MIDEVNPMQLHLLETFISAFAEKWKGGGKIESRGNRIQQMHFLTALALWH